MLKRHCIGALSQPYAMPFYIYLGADLMADTTTTTTTTAQPTEVQLTDTQFNTLTQKIDTLNQTVKSGENYQSVTSYTYYHPTNDASIVVLHQMTYGDIVVSVSIILALVFMILKWFISTTWR
jgi:hypothetical protein